MENFAAIWHVVIMENDLCEMQIKGGWGPIAVSDALELNPALLKRCLECHGQVRAHRASNNGMKAHFEHIEAHPGCSRSTGVAFSGKSTPHPKAME